MAALDVDTVSKYLERSMQNCSLSNQRMSFEDGFGVTDESDGDHIPIIDITLELNSHIPVPYHLEQCLDLKTGDVNRNSGMRVKKDPRKLVSSSYADQFSGDSTVTVFSEEGSSYYESEESSSESSREIYKEEVLVVAGCKACFMYVMVPKLLTDCPKCEAQLLHFWSTTLSFSLDLLFSFLVFFIFIFTKICWLPFFSYSPFIS
ncbi:unnamed protein product [Brassica oleracea]|uniref:Uncharacterized protein n=1 Tax=Brassica oleracea var. oleracea TaxID=109376 RepID=A0A0D3D6C4_BRAOL|nr:PREDICTED: uncharacterized protein LOC106305059 [Brassica oleracea var. oleracea]